MTGPARGGASPKHHAHRRCIRRDVVVGIDMRAKTSKLGKHSTVKNMSAKAKHAARAFRDVKVASTPAKLRGKKSGAIQRAVRDYYLG